MVLRDLRKQIEDILNNSNLPIDAIYFVMKDICAEIDSIYNQEILKETTAEKAVDEEKKGDKKD